MKTRYRHKGRPNDSKTGIFLSGFKVYYRKEHSEWTVVNVTAQNRSYTATDLRCGTLYKLHMRAVNRVGEGIPSETVTARTNGSRKSF